MNVTEYSIGHGRVIAFFLAVMLVGGAVSFFTLGKKEDAPFVIKTAVVTVKYPGANPEQVEQLVTEPVEREIQSMGHVRKILSESYYGLAKITVELDPGLAAERIPQMWDELRRKILNVEGRLPASVSEIDVSDDFGDVFGIYYGLSAGEGFSYAELRQQAQLIKRELVTVPGVQKVTLFGEQTPVVNVYISRSKLAGFSLRPEDIISVMSGQNAIVSVDGKLAGQMEIRITETSTYASVEDIENQILTTPSGRQIRLSDIADVQVDYRQPPSVLMRVNGVKGIGIGISTEASRDVVKTGRAVGRRLHNIEAGMPVGMELTELYPEDRIARQANGTFVLNLIESVAIVVLVVMLAMGMRAGAVIGSSLLFAIGGTLLLMQVLGEGLNRTSLAGFIIAMGMLVDNAIVVTDNARQMMAAGVARRTAVSEGAGSVAWELFGATLIGIFSFLPLYMAPSSVAEIVKPLFVVLAVSLMLSWVLSLTQVPLMGAGMLVSPRRRQGYDTPFFRSFDRTLRFALRYPRAVFAGAYVLLGLSLWGMSVMPQNFFPSLDKPYFRADCTLPDGYNIDDMSSCVERMERWLMEQSEVKTVSSTMGASPPRYYLASSSRGPAPNFANLLVELHDKKYSETVERRFNDYVRSTFPDVWISSSLFKLSPVPDATIEFGFIGDNADTLASLTSAALAIMRSDERTNNVRSSWGNRIPVWTPVYSQVKGPRLGVSRSDMAQYLNLATSGYRLGDFRSGDQFLPILLKDENMQGYNLSNMRSLPMFSAGGKVYPLEQVVERFSLGFELPVIKRYNRSRVMCAQCDPARGENAVQLYEELQKRIVSEISLPQGYSMKVFGEQESREESNRALAAGLPVTFLGIFTVLLLLFGDYRKPVVILLMVPLVFVGVVLGLVSTGKMFDFFSLLGLLGLVGMNVKNAVVLVSRIEETSRVQEPYEALIAAARCRLVPVAVASGTTILGLVPLLPDAMFGSMAATIMGGLLVATFLTVIVLPAGYAVLFKIKPAEKH